MLVVYVSVSRRAVARKSSGLGPRSIRTSTTAGLPEAKASLSASGTSLESLTLDAVATHRAAYGPVIGFCKLRGDALFALVVSYHSQRGVVEHDVDDR